MKMVQSRIMGVATGFVDFSAAVVLWLTGLCLMEAHAFVGFAVFVLGWVVLLQGIKAVFADWSS